MDVQSDIDISAISVIDQPVPIAYTFRLPPNEKSQYVRSPPFHILIDHTIGVIWALFTKRQVDKKLGIVQLQWALNFLKTIYNTNGEHPIDVSICIDVIEDALIAQYADMIGSLSPSYNFKDDSSSSCPSSSSSQSSHYASTLTTNLTTKESIWPPPRSQCDEQKFSPNYGDIYDSITTLTIPNKEIQLNETNPVAESKQDSRRNQLEQIQYGLTKLKSLERIIKSVGTNLN